MNNQSNTSKTSSSKMLRAMVGIGTFCGLLIVLSFEGTLPRIERLQAEALQQAVFKVVPGTDTTRALAWDGAGFIKVEEGMTEVVYAGYDKEGKLKGVAIEASGQGYADIIRILYGYDPENQTVIGFYVLESKETPGLGDLIETDENFLSNFKALDVKLNETLTALLNEVVQVDQGTKTNAWEIDGITGATISSRAIAEIINESAAIWVPRVFTNKGAFEQQP